MYTVHQYQACSMSSPPSDGPPLPASCCRLFHWISSSSMITVCCFLNRARVLWCFSASSYAQTYIMLFNHWRIWWKILILVYTNCLCVSCGFSVPVCISVRCWPLVWARPLVWTSCFADPILSEHAQLEECWPNYSTELYIKEKTLINWLKKQFNDSLLKSIPCVELGMFLPFISEWLIKLEFNMFKTDTLWFEFQKTIYSHIGHRYGHQTRQYCPKIFTPI